MGTLAHPMIKARAETLFTKPAFKAPAKRHSCLIPAIAAADFKSGVGNLSSRFGSEQSEECLGGGGQKGGLKTDGFFLTTWFKRIHLA